MPIYEFKCTRCHQRYETPNRDEKASCGVTLTGYDLSDPDDLQPYRPICAGTLKRVFSFSIGRSMPEHFNNSTGTYVTNKTQLADDFKRLSEAATERTGIPHNFVPVDPQDKETLGVTDEGLDSTHDVMVRKGLKDETSPRKVIKLR